MAGYSALAAGSAFLHASATKVGQLGDVFTMDLIMYQTHQLMVTKVLQVTSRALSQADRNTIFQLDSGAGLAANKARDLHGPTEANNLKDGLHMPTFHEDGLQAVGKVRRQFQGWSSQAHHP